jgi:hypothetical protein
VHLLPQPKLQPQPKLAVYFIKALDFIIDFLGLHGDGLPPAAAVTVGQS